MKRKFQLVLILLISIITITIAQVSEEEKAMSQGINNALVVTIPSTASKTAERVWKNYAKQFKGKTKRNRKAEEWKTTGGKISGIDNDKLTIYAKMEDTSEGVELSMWIPMSEGYLSSTDYEEEYEAASKMLDDYALEVRIETVKGELEREEKALAKSEKDLEKLKKDNEGYHKDIENAESRIDDSEEGLITNKEDQKIAVQNVRDAEDFFADQEDKLQEALADAASKDEKKSVKKLIRTEEKKVKSAKSEQKKEEKEEKKLRKTIANAKKTITESEEKIVTNVSDQERKVEEIEKKKELVAEVEQKLKELYDLK